MMSSMTTPVEHSLAQSKIVYPKYTGLPVNTNFGLKRYCCFSREASAKKSASAILSSSKLAQALHCQQSPYMMSSIPTPINQSLAQSKIVYLKYRGFLVSMDFGVKGERHFFKAASKKSASAILTSGKRQACSIWAQSSTVYRKQNGAQKFD